MSKISPSILISSDLYRYEGASSFKLFLKLLFKNPFFRFQVYLRMTQSSNFLIACIFKFLKAGLGRKVNVQLSPKVSIGYGLYIPHGNIVVNARTSIGNNCSLLQFVSIGAINNSVAACIGDNVYIGPNTNLVGSITIANNAVLGAGSVVVKDVDENMVMVGCPAKGIKKVLDINEYSNNLCSDDFINKANK
jgi:serine O-acetyltransferase